MLRYLKPKNFGQACGQVKLSQRSGVLQLQLALCVLRLGRQPLGLLLRHKSFHLGLLLLGKFRIFKLADTGGRGGERTYVSEAKRARKEVLSKQKNRDARDFVQLGLNLCRLGVQRAQGVKLVKRQDDQATQVPVRRLEAVRLAQRLKRRARLRERKKWRAVSCEL